MTAIETKLEEHSISESSQFQITSKQFLIQTCSYCNKIMELREGDVIYGDKWFHNFCWKLIKNEGTK